MKAIATLLCAVLLFGCVGEEVPPAEERPIEERPPVEIILDPQKNQTAERDGTEDPRPPESNETGLGYRYDPDQILGVFFIDVGGPGLHGDAILIKKGDLDILIDCGSAEKGGAVVDFLRSYAVDDIEVLISTGADPRRYGGMDAVSDSFHIEEIWWSGETHGNADYQASISRASSKAGSVRVVGEGFNTELNGIVFSVLNPPAAAKDRFLDFNNDAIVLKVEDREFSMLLTSGIQTGAQGRLASAKRDMLPADVMQAPYYGVGAGTSFIGLLLLAVDPKDVVITGSSDDSAANGGSREPFKRLMDQYGMVWHESYANGGLRITSDGTDYAILQLGAGN